MWTARLVQRRRVRGLMVSRLANQKVDCRSVERVNLERASGRCCSVFLRLLRTATLPKEPLNQLLPFGVTNGIQWISSHYLQVSRQGTPTGSARYSQNTSIYIYIFCTSHADPFAATFALTSSSMPSGRAVEGCESDCRRPEQGGPEAGPITSVGQAG